MRMNFIENPDDQGKIERDLFATQELNISYSMLHVLTLGKTFCVSN